MNSPDQRLMMSDLEDGPFLIGDADGRWGRAAAKNVNWPNAVFWIAAARRNHGPERFHFLLNCAEYPNQPPTGTLWDPSTETFLAIQKWPKGRDRVQAVFRADSQQGRALYHPYDRVSLAHGQHATNWPNQYPHLVWTAKHTIVDFLEAFHELLNSTEYAHV